MRAPAVGLFFAGNGEEEVVNAIGDVTVITHVHPLGREGAVIVGLATALAYNDAGSNEIVHRLGGQVQSAEFLTRLQTVAVWLQTGIMVSPQVVVSELGNGIAAVDSCVTAVYLALAFRESSFDDLLEFAISLGGDVDTIAAMACAVWGAARGIDELPQTRLEQLEECGYLQALSRSFAENAGNRQEQIS
jgi:poly(ADP-ribose) glycohydrolase ARH3